MWWMGANALEDGTAKSINDLREIAEKLTRLVLSRQIRKLCGDRIIEEVEIQILVKAKNARNFIAHAALAPVSYVSRFSRHAQIENDKFQSALHDLVLGDNLISSWSYMFHEKEAAPSDHMAQYPGKLERWILEPYMN